MTTDRTRRRLLAVEARHAPSRGGVLRLQAGESVVAALDRARRQGRTGSFLIAPPLPDVATWTLSTQRQQRVLMQRAAHFAAHGVDPGDPLESAA